MHYSTRALFLITLFGFLSSLAFNNRIENLTLISNKTFLRAPIFGGPEAVPLLPAGRAGPGERNAQMNTLHDIKSMSLPGMDKPAERLSR